MVEALVGMRPQGDAAREARRGLDLLQVSAVFLAEAIEEPLVTPTQGWPGLRVCAAR